MNCPLCVDEVLDVTHHGGIEIDVCPRCRGIWLDRGELDRLVGPVDAPARVEAPAATTSASTKASDEQRKKNRKRRLMDKLGDALEEVLDL